MYEFRLMNKKDLPIFLRIRNEVSEYLHDNRKFTIGEAEIWWANQTTEYWLILRDGVCIGYFRLQNSNQDYFLIGADLDTDFQNRGIGSEVYPIFIEQKCKQKNLRLRVLKTNKRALALYLKLRFNIISETEIDYEMELINQFN